MNKTVDKIAFVAAIIGVFFWGMSIGDYYGRKNIDITKMEFNEKTFPQLVERCKSVQQAEMVANAVINIISEEGMR